MTSSNLLIAGLGASAGGFEAFKSFLQHMPPDSGMSFVLVQHLAPEKTSMLAELLRRDTKMEVVEAEEGMAVESNPVVVISPDPMLTLKHGRLHLERPACAGNAGPSMRRMRGKCQRIALCHLRRLEMTALDLAR